MPHYNHVNVRHIQMPPNCPVPENCKSTFFFPFLLVFQFHIAHKVSGLETCHMMLSCFILSASFLCVFSQNKQPLVYFEHAKTSLLEELGQALCRDLNFSFVCMTVEGSLSAQGSWEQWKKVWGGNSPSLLKTQEEVSTKGKDVRKSQRRLPTGTREYRDNLPLGWCSA